MFAATTSPWYLPVVVSGQMPGDVADRPEPVTGAQVRVDGDPVAVGLDADGLEPDAVDPRMPARRDEETVARQLGCRRRRSGRSRRRRGAPRVALHAEHELDAVTAQDLAERLAQRCRLVRQQVVRRGRRARPRLRVDARPAPSRRRRDPHRGRAAGAGPRSSRSPPGSSTRRPARADPGSAAAIGSAPVATTTWSAVWRTPPTSTTPVPASRPSPRSRSMPRSVSHCSAPASVWFDTMKSRQASAAATSTSRSRPRRSPRGRPRPGRSSVFDGMHAQ